MLRRIQTALMVGLVAVLCAGSSTPVSAQETMETISETIDVKVVTGTVVHRAGQTVVVKIKDGSHKGLQKFVLGSQAKITRNGVPAKISDLRKGDQLVQTMITTRRGPVKVTMEEVEEMIEAAPPAPAPVSAPVMAEPAREELPAELPKTASLLPAMLVAGLTLSLIGLGILSRRRVEG